MEKASLRNFHLCLSLAELVGFYVFDAIFVTVRRLHKFCSRSFRCTSSRVHNEESNNYVVNDARGDRELRGEDVETVMERMGMSFGPEDNNTVKRFMNSDDFSAIFEEDEPSLEEVKEAFCVFDENCDGFIDAAELQRVLCKLGFREGVDLESCQKMIIAHDQNQDGRVDFHEFVMFMENCLC